MVKRKVYTTAREGKIDQLIGFVAFPIVNLVAWWLAERWAAYSPDSFYPLWLPWIINGVWLIWALIFRPHIALGYTVFIALGVITVIMLGVLFLPACFAFAGVASLVQSGQLALCLCGGLVFLGGIAILIKVSDWFDTWWNDSASLESGTITAPPSSDKPPPKQE